MADTTFGFTYNGTWAGVITSVDDPNKSGRVQVRIYGHTDDTVNIPDDCLPWIMPLQPITSAASSKVGTSPVGVIVGTNVFGIWSDSDMQIPIILGSWGKDGIISSGSSTSDGAPKIDTTKGSIPPAAVGIENNPRSVLNSTTYLTPSSTDGCVITKEVEKGMTNAKLPTTCFADKTDNSDVLTIIKKVDPFNTSLSIPCLGITFPSLKQLLAMLVGIVGKIAGQLKAILIAAIQNAIFMLCQKYGVFKVLSLLNSAALAIKEVANLLGALNNIHICGINLFNQKTFDAINGVMAETIYGINTITHIVPIATGAISVGVNNVFDNIVTEPLASVATGSTPVPPSISLAAPSAYIQQYSAVDLYPGYKTFVDPYGQGNPVYTARNGEPNYISAEQHTFFVAQKSFVSGLESSIINNTLSSTGLYSLFGSVTSITQAFAATRILGVGFGTALAIGAGAIAVTSLVHNIPQVYNPQPSLLPSNSLVNQSMTDFTTKRFALNNIATQARIGVGAYS